MYCSRLIRYLIFTLQSGPASIRSVCLARSICLASFPAELSSAALEIRSLISWVAFLPIPFLPPSWLGFIHARLCLCELFLVFRYHCIDDADTDSVFSCEVFYGLILQCRPLPLCFKEAVIRLLECDFRDIFMLHLAFLKSSFSGFFFIPSKIRRTSVRMMPFRAEAL